MTLLDAAFEYQSWVGEQELRALDHVREVYGIYRLQLVDKDSTIFLTYDASRLTVCDVAVLLRAAGLALRDPAAIAA